MDSVYQEMNLLLPAIGAVLCAVAAVLPAGMLRAVGPLIKAASKLPYLSWLEILHKGGRSKLGLLRLAFGIAALTSFLFVGGRDYSSFFPHRFKIRVYFDDAELLKALGEFNKEELASLNLKGNWQTTRGMYFRDLNQRLDKAKEAFRFYPTKTYGGGDGVIVGQMAHWGIQKYRIVEGHGNLVFANDDTRGEATTLVTAYELRDTPENFITVGFLDIYRMKPLVIMPEFNQVIKRTMGSQKEIDHVLCTATKIKFMPYVDIGTTIYLFKQDDGRRVPIGYAIYEPSQ